RSGKQPNQFFLCGIDVLVFVHEEVLKWAVDTPKDVWVVERLDGFRNQLTEGEKMVAMEHLDVAGVALPEIGPGQFFDGDLLVLDDLNVSQKVGDGCPMLIAEAIKLKS